MTEHECELLWFLRKDCKQMFPNSLNKLLISFKWNNQRMIGETLCLLHTWPKLSPGKALELLDYAYADSMVRKFAIQCLRGKSKNESSNGFGRIIKIRFCLNLDNRILCTRKLKFRYLKLGLNQ